MTQLSMTERPAIGVAGQLADARRLSHVLTAIVALAAGLMPGLLVVHGYRPNEVTAITPGIAADVAAVTNAFILSTASPTVNTTYSTPAQCAGAVGLSVFTPPRRFTLTLSNHANWSATTAVLTYLNEDGIQVSENLSIPSNGNTTLYSSGRGTKLVSLYIPAQGGAGGTFTLGSAIYQSATAIDMASNVSSYITSTASPTSNTTYSTQGQVAGIIGLNEMPIARKLQLVLSNHANWSATTAIVTYINELGQQVSENLAIPSGGNTTLYTQGFCARLVSLFIPTQGGALGTFTLGAAAGGVDSPSTGARINLRLARGVTVYEDMKTGGPPDYPYANRAKHLQYDLVPILDRGAIYVAPEEAVSEGQLAWVRVVASGNQQLGAFRASPDPSAPTSCVPFHYAYFGSNGDSTSLAKLIVDMRNM